MRTAMLFVLLGLFTVQIFGQIPDSTGGQPADTTTPVPTFLPPEPYQAPAPSSLAELLYRTQRGEFDPVRVIGETADQGFPIVDSLGTILWGEPDVVEQAVPEELIPEAEPTQSPGDIDTPGLQRMRIYALIALQAMNKSEAYTLLTEVAASHSDIELRGIALNVLSTSMHEQTTEATPPPSVELIHILLSNAGDTTHVEFFSSTIGEIARRGLNNWMGMNFGTTGDPQRIIRVGEEQTEMTMSQYRVWWWEQSKERLVWNAEEKVFSVQ